jgi:predicted PurR-regulated permease PerM
MARRTSVASLVLVLLVVGALALWEMRLILLLFLIAVVIACAMRPGVEALRRRGIPSGVGIALHYAVLASIIATLLLFAVPRALSEVQSAIASLPETRAQIHEEAARSSGLRHDVLTGVERRLADLPSREKLVEPGVELTRSAIASSALSSRSYPTGSDRKSETRGCS